MSTTTYKNAYVLVDRSYVSTPEIFAIQKRCQDIGLNPWIDGRYMDASCIFLPDWQAETLEQGYINAIEQTIAYLEEIETTMKMYELEDLKKVPSVIAKLLRLAKCPAAAFGEKRNAVDAAYRIALMKEATQ